MSTLCSFFGYDSTVCYSLEYIVSLILQERHRIEEFLHPKYRELVRQSKIYRLGDQTTQRAQYPARNGQDQRSE